MLLTSQPALKRRERIPGPYQVSSRRSQPCLRFTPTAWAKLVYLRDCGQTEVGGFGITASSDQVCVEDLKLVSQHCSSVFVSFEDQAVADYFDRQVDRGLKPEQFARIWVHTHPGNSPQPSNTDEETFERVFGRSDWAVMFILAESDQTYARLRFSIGPGGDIELPVSVDYSQPFSASDWPAWQQEYEANVRLIKPRLPTNQFDPLNWWEDEQLLDAAAWQEELLFDPAAAADVPF